MLIAGRYQPLEPARPGVPLRARDLQTAQTVWLREQLLPMDADDAIARAQRAKGIFHPSLVTLFDVVALPDARLLLAYEFVPAQTMAQASGGPPFNAKRAAAIATEVADAVAELHARGITHGGISQQTVLLTLKGKAKLDRLGDPSIAAHGRQDESGDITAIAALLQDLIGPPALGGIVGQHGLETVIDRARSGKLTSAAALAAMLRRLSE